MYSLYWIKYQNYSNPKKDGYIGISSRPEERFIEHKKWSPLNPRLKRAINKGAEMEVLKENLSYEEALNLEIEYRPIDNIGWNISKGGQVPPNKKGYKYKEGKQILKGENRTNNQKNASKIHSEKMKGLTPWNKGKTGFKGPCKPCTYKGLNFNSRKEAAEHFNISVSAVTRWIKKNQ
jgi:hypothetical protein